MTEQIPPLPAGLVPAGVDAGVPDRHHANRAEYGLLRVVIWGVVLGGLFFCGMGYRNATGPYAFNHRTGYLMIGILGVPGLLAGLGLVVWHRGHSTMQVWTTPAGLAWCNALTGGFVRWDDLSKHYRNVMQVLHHGQLVRTNIFLTIETSNGQRVLFRNNLQRILELADRLDREIAGRQLAPALESVRAGGTATFDRLSLSPQGIGWRGTTLPWTAVQAFELSRGHVRIRKQGKSFAWASTPAGDLPNFPLLLALVKDLHPALLKTD